MSSLKIAQNVSLFIYKVWQKTYLHNLRFIIDNKKKNKWNGNAKLKGEEILKKRFRIMKNNCRHETFVGNDQYVHQK